jgi:CMP-N-acetylneuraminic acid synthetase
MPGFTLDRPGVDMKLTALLPMKGNSERVPNKNMRDFYGRPLYHAVMESLRGSVYILKIVINTDSEKIKEDAVKNFENRIVIHDRPEAIRGDFVSMNEIIANDLERLEGEHFLQTHSTNPLLKTATIDRSIERYFKVLDEGYDSLFSVTRLQSRLYNKNGAPINHNPEELLRTQDLRPVYEENSCIYIFNRRGFTGNGKRRAGRKPLMFEIPREEAVDIDEEIDFRVAEFLYKALKKRD